MAIAKSDEAKSSTCFSGILRCFFCNGGLPTHPADQFIESNEKEKDCDQKLLPKPDDYKEEVAEISKTMPSVVARLMGLESFPSRNRTLGSYLRSRSVNSIDFSNQFDLTKKLLHYQHRRVRTSVSFREELDHGFVLSELNEVADESEELVIKKRRPKEVKVHKEKGIKGDKLQETTNVNKNCRVGNVACKNGKTRVNLRERRLLIKQVDCKEALVAGPNYVKKKWSSTQNFHSDRRNVHSKCTAVTEVSRLEPWRKPLSSRIADSQSPCSSDVHFEEGAAKSINKGKAVGRKMKNGEKSYYKRMMETICSVTKEDLEENWKQGSLEEICQQFGQEILQVMLKQIVDELLLVHGIITCQLDC